MADKTESTPDVPEEQEPAYVSDQLAVKTWSVLARDLREGKVSARAAARDYGRGDAGA